MSRPRLTGTELFMIIVGLLYVLSPVDVVPELIAGPLGLVDDTAAIALIGATLVAAGRRPAPATVVVTHPDAGSGPIS
jgi:uncharacterized membrane protein YkvA (DUF1232 family)